MARSATEPSPYSAFDDFGSYSGFHVTGTNRTPRRHTYDFDTNPLQVQGRRPRSVLIVPTPSLTVPEPAVNSAIRFPSSQPLVQIPTPVPQPALVRRSTSSSYRPSPLSRTSSFPTVEESEEDEDGQTAGAGPSRHRDNSARTAGSPGPRPMTLHQSSLLRRASSRSLGGGGRNPPTSYHPPRASSIRKVQSHTSLPTHAGTPGGSSSRLSQTWLPDDVPSLLTGSPMAIPSTSRNPDANWLTATTAPRFSRTALPSVVMPLPATNKNRAKLTSRLSVSSSAVDELTLPIRPGFTRSRSSSQTSDASSSDSSWDSLGTSMGCDSPNPHSLQTSPLSSEAGDHQIHAKDRFSGKLKKLWKSVVGKARV